MEKKKEVLYTGSDTEGGITSGYQMNDGVKLKVPYSFFGSVYDRDEEEMVLKAMKQESQTMGPQVKLFQDEFAKKFGRKYGFFETYKIEDAELVLVACGSTCGTARVVVDKLREKGIKVGLLKIHVVRPFLQDELLQVLSGAKLLIVLDRSDTMSTMGGPVYVELRSALYNSRTRPLLVNYIYGLGGRDTSPDLIHKIYRDLQQILKTQRIEEPVQFIGLRE